MTACAERFVAYLEEHEFKFSTTVDKDGDDVISFPYKGKDVRMFFSGDDGKYLSLYLVYENVPEDRVAEAIFACNDMNVKYKWVTYYLDRDRDIVLHDDAILSLDDAADEAFELLVRMIRISDEAKVDLMKAIYA